MSTPLCALTQLTGEAGMLITRPRRTASHRSHRIPFHPADSNDTLYPAHRNILRLHQPITHWESSTLDAT